MESPKSGLLERLTESNYFSTPPLYHRCKKIYLLFIGLIFLTPKSFSQSVYPNIDFEDGNFSGWNAATGNCCPILTPVNGFVSLRHTIMNGSGTDPYTLGQVPVVAPGGNFSARLGNDSVGGEAEKLSFTFVVSPSAPLFVYRYAVVFEFPPDHPPVKQPRFEITVKDAIGNILPCGFYQVACANNIPGFVANGDYRFKPWTDVGVDLTEYIGEQITIEFATGDCGMGGHFGYAYIDGYATELKITSGSCNPDGSITLTAPPGFTYNWSNGETTQQATIHSISGGNQVSVELSAVTGCSKTISFLVPDFVPTADFSFIQKCNHEITFTDKSTVSNAIITNWSWHFGNGSFSSAINPVQQFSSQGNYPVTLTVDADNNCKGSITRDVNVEALVKAGFSFSLNGNFCIGESILFSDLSHASVGTIISWHWNFDDLAYSSFQNPEHIYYKAGVYHPQLFITTDEGCTDSISEIISVNDCNNETGIFLYIPNSFSPNGDGINDVFTVMGENYSEIEMSIFNRWGQKVMVKEGYNITWNGLNSNSQPMPEGVYTYRLVATDFVLKSYNYTGFIVLLR